MGFTAGPIRRPPSSPRPPTGPAGIVLGKAIALATLLPMMDGLTGEGRPYIPPLVHGAFAGTTIVLGLTAAGPPARAPLRRDTLEE
ncbi:hypothetical protein [Streptomyces sviceus]|uniref:hypothetical protein n=1 Tax=Streptomyces sviceus TaxID=285530 RepID=UPI0036E3FD3C